MTDMKVLRIASVVARTGLARPTIYKLMASGKFPRKIKLTTRASGWLADEVNLILRGNLPLAINL